MSAQRELLLGGATKVAWLFFLLLFLAVRLSAQSGERVLHVWVDPHYGVDAGGFSATAFNPNGVNGCVAGEFQPVDVRDAAGLGTNLLLHEPYPFRTINGQFGALSTIPVLPFTSLVTGVRWDYAVIHLLPGRYAPITALANNQYSGMQSNQEVFPINLPDRVSLQGTSALNTILELDGLGPAIQFGVVAGSAGQNSFVDGVAIYNGIGGTLFNPAAGSAIYLGPNQASTPTITNCFLYGNQVGILINSGDSDDVIHRPTLFNNTIAWNQCGVWNGWFPLQIGQQNAIGVSLPACVNNIFDATPDRRLTTPYPFPLFTGVTTSGFEGLDVADLTVSSVTPPADYNAYEQDAGGNKYNLQTAFLGFLPATQPRVATPAAPGINIAAFTGGTSTVNFRGVLYVRDLLSNGRANFQANNLPWDASPHDFRLSPAVAPAWITIISPGSAPTQGGVPGGALNPLVDRGCSTFPLTLLNARTISNKPGFLTLPTSQSTYNHTPYDKDCEGSGNPRVHDHPLYLSTGGRLVDIGADELGELIVVGYRFGTTHFFNLTNLPGGVNPMDNKYLWYLGAPATLNNVPSPTSVARPFYHAHRLASGFFGGPGPSNMNFAPWYAVGPWLFGPRAPTFYYEPSIIPILTEITPHLSPDIHPWWGLGFASFPVWQTCPPAPSYKPALYVNPSAGVINPPGTTAFPALGFAYLDGLTGTPFPYGIGALHLILNSNPMFPIVLPWFGGAATLDLFDTWCRGTATSTGLNMDTMVRTVNSANTIVALRYSLENKTDTTWSFGLGTNHNVQSFLVMVEAPAQ